jgi:hypothetical protein
MAMAMIAASISITVKVPFFIMPFRMPIFVFSAGDFHDAARDPAVAHHGPFFMLAPAPEPVPITNDPI